MARTSRSHAIAITPTSPVTCMGLPTDVGKCCSSELRCINSGTFSSSGTIESGLLEEEMVRVAEGEEIGTYLG